MKLILTPKTRLRSILYYLEMLKDLRNFHCKPFSLLRDLFYGNFSVEALGVNDCAQRGKGKSAGRFYLGMGLTCAACMGFSLVLDNSYGWTCWSEWDFTNNVTYNIVVCTLNKWNGKIPWTVALFYPYLLCEMLKLLNFA